MDIDYFLRTKYEENQVEGVLRTEIISTSINHLAKEAAEEILADLKK